MTGADLGQLLSLHDPQARGRILLLGVNDGRERARLLRAGFGEATSDRMDLDELEARAALLADRAANLPRYRRIGGARLDLLARDGFADDKPLGLHPREFGLLWRLADTPGVPVSKRELVEDVWRLAFVPETNSLAVHVSRLRAKLERAGLGALIETGASGSYCLHVPASPATRAVPLDRDKANVDDYVRSHGEGLVRRFAPGRS